MLLEEPLKILGYGRQVDVRRDEVHATRHKVANLFLRLHDEREGGDLHCALVNIDAMEVSLENGSADLRRVGERPLLEVHRVEQLEGLNQEVTAATCWIEERDLGDRLLRHGCAVSCAQEV